MIARIKLTEEQEEQIRAMSKDGKRNKEIIDHFKTAYNIGLNSSRVCYICYGRKGKGTASAENPRRAKAQHKYISKKKRLAEKAQDTGEVDIKELIVLLQEIDTGYKKLLEYFKNTLKNLRGELVRSRAEVHEMMKGAGIEVPGE